MIDVIFEICMQVMWNCLILVVEEQVMMLLCIVFLILVCEVGDLLVGVFDLQGWMLVQVVIGMLGYVNIMVEVVLYFMVEILCVEMFLGDIYVINDLWKGMGYLYDIIMVLLFFKGDELVGFFVCIVYVVDVGGCGFGVDGKLVYEEGIQILIMKFVECGQVNCDLIRILCSNVCEVNQVVGDFFLLVVCNDVGYCRLIVMMDEIGLFDLDGLGEFIFLCICMVMLECIVVLLKGVWLNMLLIDGYDSFVKLVVIVQIGVDVINVDFIGIDLMSRYGINVLIIYIKVYVCYVLKCVVVLDIFNNWVLFEVFMIFLLVNILNVECFVLVFVCYVIGYMVFDLVLGVLVQVLFGQVLVEGVVVLWNIYILVCLVVGQDGWCVEILMFNLGGMGVWLMLDGLNVMVFFLGVMIMLIEVIEQIGFIVVWCKELCLDSGGDG